MTLFFWLGLRWLIPELLREGGMRGCWDGRQRQNLICLLSTASLLGIRPLAVRLGNELSGLRGLYVLCTSSMWVKKKKKFMFSNLTHPWPQSRNSTPTSVILSDSQGLQRFQTVKSFYRLQPFALATYTFFPTSATPHWITQIPLLFMSLELITQHGPAHRLDPFSYSFITLPLPPSFLAVAHDLAARQTIPLRFI